MSGLDSIIKKITDEAEAKADEIMCNAETEAEKISSEAAAEIDEYNKKRYAYAEAEAAKARERVISGCMLECKKQILTAKQQIIDDAMEKAKEAILNMPAAEYEEFLATQIVSAADSGNEAIVLTNRDHDRISLLRFLVTVNTKLKQDGIKDAKLTISSEILEAESGFLLKKGDIVIDNSLDKLLKSKRDELEIELSSLLF